MFHNFSALRLCHRRPNYRVPIAIRNILNNDSSAARFPFQFRCSLYHTLVNRTLRSRGLLTNHNVGCSKLSKRCCSQKGSGKGNRDMDMSTLWKFVFLSVVLAYAHSVISTYFSDTISWNFFIYDLLSKGYVEEIIVVDKEDLALIIVKDDAVTKRVVLNKSCKLLVSNVKNFEDEIREIEDRLGVSSADRVVVKHRIFSMQQVLMLTVTTYLLWILTYGGKTGILRLHPFNMSKAKFTLIDPLAGYGKGVKFSDVAGLHEAKQEIMEFVDYLKRPEHYENLGAKVPKGALLLGPPGCGKTLLAKAVATEANVPFLSMNGSEFVELIGGLGAARVRHLFSEARKRRPCIIYIDEIDAIGRKRSESTPLGAAYSEGEHTLNQLLVEMDGMKSKEGVVMLASTNRGEVLDVALLRPGRFDRHIMIDLPTVEERREIFVRHMKNIHMEYEPEYYAKRMASLTPGFSGADIANICNEAALHAARYKKQIVKAEDLEYAVERTVGGTEKRSGSISHPEKELIAYHESGRALVGWLSDSGEALLKISVVPRTHQIVGWTQFATQERFLMSDNELFDKMCMALGGRVAETLMFNQISTKAERDLKKVTRIAYAQVRQFGMSNVVGLVSFDDNEQQKKPYSKHLAALMDEEARKLITKAYRRAETIIHQNKDKLILLSQELLKRETLNYKDVEKLIGPPANVKKKIIEPLEFDLSLDEAAGPEPPPAAT